MSGYPLYTIIVPRLLRRYDPPARPPLEQLFYHFDATDRSAMANVLQGVRGSRKLSPPNLPSLPRAPPPACWGEPVYQAQTDAHGGGAPIFQPAPVADRLEFYFDHVPLPGYGWLFHHVGHHGQRRRELLRQPRHFAALNVRTIPPEHRAANCSKARTPSSHQRLSLRWIFPIRQ